MKKHEGENFVINYQEGLQDFVLDSLKIWNERKSLLSDLFGCIIPEKIKASFFVERAKFEEYIKEISNGQTPPSWATGCFYNGEIQTLIDINNPKNYQAKAQTLLHEMVHLHFDRLIYQKHRLDRVRWFDESYALYLDGTSENASQKMLFEICDRLRPIQDFNLNTLNDIKKVKTKTYDAYDIFMIVGRFIFENHLEKQYLALLTSSPNEIKKIGKVILSSALEYFATKKSW